MVIPIQLRGQILGSLALVRRPCRRQQTEESAATERGEPEVSTQESAEISAKPQPGSAQTPIWTEEDLDLATQIINQVGPALENARLLEESHAAAAREQIVNLITTNIRSSNNPEIIMQATVRELGRILGASRTFIHLDPAAWPPARLPDQENAGGDMA
jgi:GAF domain-containing protein